jgi:hypothetical protein
MNCKLFIPAAFISIAALCPAVLAQTTVECGGELRYFQKEVLEHNLLANGSFEDGPIGLGLTTLPGWIVKEENVDVIGMIWANPYTDQAPCQGQQSLELVGTPPGVGDARATIQQSFATVPGTRYAIIGWMSHHPGIWRGDMNVTVNGVAVRLSHTELTTSSNMAWRQFLIPFTAILPTTTLELSDVTGLWTNGGSCVDGLSVVSVDAAVTKALEDLHGVIADATEYIITAIKASLLAKVDAALTEIGMPALDAASKKAVAGVLRALSNEVQAQNGKKISADLAADIIARVNEVLAMILL